MKILLVQLGSNGDCLFVTAIAKQIKEIDFPGCHLTWIIGSAFSGVIKNNPHIDEVFEFPITNIHELSKYRDLIPELILSTEQNYDRIFITDHMTGANWFGTTRASIFRNYPFKIKNPEPQLFLTDEEKENVKNFCIENEINGYNILIESSPQSRQSNMTPDSAFSIAEAIATNNIKVILSSKERFVSTNPNIIDGSKLSWRENAGLTHYCNLLVGCSSGISWLNTSNAAAKIPTIQTINPFYFNCMVTPSLKIDFQYFGLSTKKIIELANPNTQVVIDCINRVIKKGFKQAKKRYDYKGMMGCGGKYFLKELIKKPTLSRIPLAYNLAKHTTKNFFKT